MVRNYVAVSVSALMVAFASNVQAATAISSSVTASGYLNVDIPNSPGVSDTDSQSQLGTVNSLSAQINLADQQGDNHGSAASMVGASWASANSGSAFFTRVGWSMNSGAESVVRLNGAYDGSKVWEYTFEATGNGSFDLNYDVYGIGDKFGLWGATIDWSGPGGGLDVSNALDPVANGIFSRAIQAGQTYTVSISNNANIYGEAGLYNDGYAYGKFDWQITESAVPGPAAALPFIGGFLMALKRRRK